MRGDKKSKIERRKATAENAASGRREPDPIGAGVERERVEPLPSPEDLEPPSRD